MSDFATDAASARGPWLNAGAEPILRAIAILNDCFNYADLVGIIPTDHDQRHCWQLVFVGESGEGIITVNVGTHKGAFFVEEPQIRKSIVPWHGPEAVRAAFALIRQRYEEAWKSEPNGLRTLATLLDSFGGKTRA